MPDLIHDPYCGQTGGSVHGVRMSLLEHSQCQHRIIIWGAYPNTYVSPTTCKGLCLCSDQRSDLAPASVVFTASATLRALELALPPMKLLAKFPAQSSN